MQLVANDLRLCVWTVRLFVHWGLDEDEVRRTPFHTETDPETRIAMTTEYHDNVDEEMSNFWNKGACLCPPVCVSTCLCVYKMKNSCPICVSAEPRTVDFSRFSRYRRWLFPALTATLLVILIIALGASSEYTQDTIGPIGSLFIKIDT